MSLQIELPIDILNILQLYIGGFVCGNMEDIELPIDLLNIIQLYIGEFICKDIEDIKHILHAKKNIDIIFPEEKTRNTVHKRLILVYICDQLPKNYLQYLPKSISFTMVQVYTKSLVHFMRFKNISGITICYMTPNTLANVGKFVNLKHLNLQCSKKFKITEDITNLNKLTVFETTSYLTNTDIVKLSTLPKLRKLNILS